MDSVSADVPFGLYPWRWARDEAPSFRALQGGLLCAPILQELILNRFPNETLNWATRVARWRFTRVIPCHLSNNIRAGPAEWLAAFSFLRAARPQQPPPAPGSRSQNTPLPAAGALPPPLQQLLDAVNSVLGGVVGEAGMPSPAGRPGALKEDLRLLTAASELCTRAGLVEAVPGAD
eukprot:scaffold19946_cov112-Isochrysis_galbana.AAC.1